MRLTPLAPDLLDPERRAVHETIVDLMVRGQPQIVAQDEHGALIGPFPAMLHFPRFGVPALRFLAAIGTEARLPANVREVAILEAESARRGMSQVKANRVITVTSERDRLAAPIEANSNPITEGKSNGWTLIYCKGCEGEQLEFVQALGPVKQTFDEALEARRGLLAATHAAGGH